MSGAVTVIVPTALRQFAGGKEEVRLAGGTVGDVLTQLTGEYPDLKQHLYKDDGQLRNFDLQSPVSALTASTATT